MVERVKLYNADCMEILPMLESGSVNLAVIDPPYNIGVKTKKNGKSVTNEWDVIDNYNTWCAEWIAEVGRVLAKNGVMYLWNNDINTICDLIKITQEKTDLRLVSFCIWDKGNAYRAQSWSNRRIEGDTALRSWFNRCEFCLHFARGVGNSKTGMEMINSTPQLYETIKTWYKEEMHRLGIDEGLIAQEYERKIGRKPYMLRHYFKDSQFSIPTRQVWETVYIPLGFCRTYESLREEYESLREEYESLRYTHNVDAMHCNVWEHMPVPSIKRKHTCQKPVDVIQRIIRVSSKPEDIVLDCFMGSRAMCHRSRLTGG